MKKIKYILAALVLTFFVTCSTGDGNYPFDMWIVSSEGYLPPEAVQALNFGIPGVGRPYQYNSTETQSDTISRTSDSLAVYVSVAGDSYYYTMNVTFYALAGDAATPDDIINNGSAASIIATVSSGLLGQGYSSGPAQVFKAYIPASSLPLGSTVTIVAVLTTDTDGEIRPTEKDQILTVSVIP